MKKAVILCLLVSFLLMGCKEEVKRAEAIRPVRTVTISEHGLSETRTFPGKVKATREVNLAFRISGQVVQLNVKEGDKVKKGQLIALLDQRDHQANIASYEAQIAGAKSILKEAELNIERSRKLIDKKIIAQSEYDSAVSTFETSRAEVLSLQQSLRKAKLNLQYTRLEAPFAGVVAVKEIDNHEYIQAKEPIIQLEDNSSLDVVLDVPEVIWAKAKGSNTDLMNHIVATFEAYPGKKFPLTLKEYQTKANSGTQTYEVTFNMKAPANTAIQPGMTAEVQGNLPNGKSGNKLNIPVSSVIGEPEGAKYVWVVDASNVVNKREVEIGRITNDMFAVDSGIAQGETIVSAGVHYLQEGQQVKPLSGRIGGRE